MTHPFQNLEDLPLEDLFTKIDPLKPQAIAIIMYFLPTLLGRKLLMQCDKKKKNEIIKKIELLSPLDESSMLALSEIILDKMDKPNHRIKINGQNILKNIIANANPELKKFISSINSNTSTPQLAAKIKFEDLNKIPDKYFQKLIKEIDRKILLLAIKTEADAFIKKLKDNLSQGAIDLLNSDIRDFGAAKKSDVMSAQESIVSLAYSLEAKGLLIFEDSEEYIN